MVTFAQAQERAELWINGDVPAYQQREVRVREFELGFVVWAEDRPDGPVPDARSEGARLVIARDSGDTTLWPALPVGEVIRRYEERYGAIDEGVEESTGGRQQRIDLNVTSFLLTPPEWLQEAADAMSLPDQRLDLPEQRSDEGPSDAPPAGKPAPDAPAAADPALGASADDWPSGGVADAAPAAPVDDWPSSGAPGAGAGSAPGSYASGGAGSGLSSRGAVVEDDWPSDAAARGARGAADDEPQDAPPAPAPGVPAAPAPGGPAAPAADQGWRNATPPPVPGGGSPWAPPAPGGSAERPAPPATPSGGTPWAGADTNVGGDDGDDRSVAPPATVFAPPLAGSDDEDTPVPGVRPDAKTKLMSAGSVLPPTAIAPSFDLPGPSGGPAAAPPPGAAPGGALGAGDIADAATRKAAPGGPTLPPPPGAPGTPGARPGAGSHTPAPPPPPSGPGAPGAPAGGYVPTQLVSQLDP
ncbi:hypothetical protein ABZS86_35185, partial [Streptomyces sp. NPDC005355]